MVLKSCLSRGHNTVQLIALTLLVHAAHSFALKQPLSSSTHTTLSLSLTLLYNSRPNSSDPECHHWVLKSIPGK